MSAGAFCTLRSIFGTARMAFTMQRRWYWYAYKNFTRARIFVVLARITQVVLPSTDKIDMRTIFIRAVPKIESVVY